MPAVQERFRQGRQERERIANVPQSPPSIAFEATFEHVEGSWSAESNVQAHSPTFPTGMHGLPAAMVLGAMFLLTTLPAPMTEPRPIVTPFSTIDRAPINTSSSIITAWCGSAAGKPR